MFLSRTRQTQFLAAENKNLKCCVNTMERREDRREYRLQADKNININIALDLVGTVQTELFILIKVKTQGDIMTIRLTFSVHIKPKQKP